LTESTSQLVVIRRALNTSAPHAKYRLEKQGKNMLLISQNEIAELTRRIQSDAQARELRALGIPFKRRRDKSLVVMRIAVEIALGVSGARIENNEPRLNLT